MRKSEAEDRVGITTQTIRMSMDTGHHEGKVHRDELASLLEAVQNVTTTLCDHARKSDIDEVMKLLEDREQLLQEMTKARTDVASSVENISQRQEMNDRFLALTQSIRTENQTLVALLEAKKKEVYKLLEEAQKQKLLISYPTMR